MDNATPAAFDLDEHAEHMAAAINICGLASAAKALFWHSGETHPEADRLTALLNLLFEHAKAHRDALDAADTAA